MKCLRPALAIALAAGAALPALAAPSAHFEWFDYRGADPIHATLAAGPGEYRNPILQGFYPDPSITRAGDDYYLVTSTFAWFPGIPVFHSRDLVNWTQIGNAIDRPDMLDFGRLGLSRGVFAPAIEHHDGLFYILNTCVDCGDNFVITARDPRGPWSDPVWLPELQGGIDPSLFFDEDGKAYLLNNGPPEGPPRYDGHRAIWIQEFDPAALRTVGPRRVLVDGGVDPSTNPIWIEGPHIIKRDGFYYLICAEGGTAEGHSQVVLRSDRAIGPYTPWSGNPILTQRDLPRDRPFPITSAGHADFVQTRNGEWWATFLAVRPYSGDYYNTGRETFLMPVSWEGGWPRITAPGELIPYVQARPDLPPQAPAPVPTSGPFRIREEFEGDALAPYWLMARNPRSAWYSLSGGALRLEARPTGLGDNGNPSFLARRQQHINATAETALRFAPSRDGDSAGLAAFQNDDYWYAIGLGHEGGRDVVQLRRRAGPEDPATGTILASEPIEASAAAPLRLRIEAEGPRYHFAFAPGDGAWRTLARDLDGTLLSTRRAGGFVGAVFGMFAVSAPEPAEADRPREIRLNQVGLLPDGPKRALLPNPSPEPLPWRLLNSAGEIRAEGRTTVIGADAPSGEHLHLVDFSGFPGTGSGFRIAVADAVSRPFPIASDVYDRLPFDALAYFYHNRAGTPIEARFAGGERWARPAGHATERATCFSGEDEAGRSWPGCDYALDVAGGWYDAGDHGKYVVNGGIALWTLLNAYERQARGDRPGLFADGRAALPEAGNGVDDLLDEARWEMEFLLSMQVPQGVRLRLPVGPHPPGAPLEFREVDASGMAHHKVADERWTALPMPPHRDPETRYLYPPSTAATLNLAATAAQCARVWREIDEAFAGRCLHAAERAYAAALRNPDIRAGNFAGSGSYGDQDVSDEFFWAAAELFVTSGRPEYERALRASRHFASPITEPSWPSTAALGTISLATAPDRLAEPQRAAVRRRLVEAADRFLEARERVGYRIPYAPPYPWGSNAVLLNRAMILALAHDFTGEPRYRSGVIDAMDYLLGRNPLDRSFVSGYGARPMRHPHHRFWAPSLDAELPPPPPGALSGGPNNMSRSDEVAREIGGTCAPQTCWRDDVRAFSLNEVAINWNAPLVWVAAWLAEEAVER